MAKSTQFQKSYGAIWQDVFSGLEYVQLQGPKGNTMYTGINFESPPSEKKP